MNKNTIGLVIGGVLIAGAAFAGGYLLSGGARSSADPRGAFGQLSQEERERMATMSDEERQAFFEEKGIDMPAGGPGGMGGRAFGATDTAGAPGGGPGGSMVFEGVVESLSGDKMTLTLTAGGSAKVYVDDSTVLAAVDGRQASIAQGADVIVVAEQEAAGVTAANVVVVQ